MERSSRAGGGQGLIEVAALFLRLGATAFGGPAAHIVLIDRECVERRRWITRQQFLDVLGVANLIPGPTSITLARTAFSGLLPVAIGIAAALAMLVARVNPSYVLLVAVLTGAVSGLAGLG